VTKFGTIARVIANFLGDSIIKEVFPRVCYDGKKGIGIAFVKEFLACPILPFQNKIMLSILLSVYHQHEEVHFLFCHFSYHLHRLISRLYLSFLHID
jgi:hypothetical protein